jgi:hypothetical protein
MVAARAELAAFLLVAAVCATTGFRPPGPPPVSEDTLEKVAASLEMYVDVLPQMPKVLGYSIKHGRPTPTPTHLTIGMYQKKWVFYLFIYFLTIYISLYIYLYLQYLSCVRNTVQS